jgi:3-dehydroquinate synthase
MRSIPVKLSHTSYEIRVGAGLVENLRGEIAQAALGEPYLLVSQPLILDAVGKGIRKKFPIALIPDGERAKTLSTVNRLLDAMVRTKLTRQSTVIAFGGGVVGDVAAFVASIYMRGVAVVQVPTTLLAQVDSSIGGKTGVNHRVGKNLIGTFHQPKLVLSDPSLLRTLPEREYASGLYEALKYGIIQDPELFAEFEHDVQSLRRRHVLAVERLVATCAGIKAHVVMADEKESDLRRILNFGHTFGHALETAAGYRRIKHGEAVGYGMIAAARISARVGELADKDRVRIENAVHSIGRLPSLGRIDLSTVLNAIQHDKKIHDGAVHFVLVQRIGSVKITPDVPMSVVRDVVREVLDEGSAQR